MRRFAVLGNPIAHSKSPEIHQAFAASLDHEVDYSRILVEPGDFNAVVTEFFQLAALASMSQRPSKAMPLRSRKSELMKRLTLRRQIPCGETAKDECALTLPTAAAYCEISSTI